MSELGWIEKDSIKGWLVTNFGKRLGGIQARYKTTGIPFVRWPEGVINNKTLITSINEAKGEITDITPESVTDTSAVQQQDDFREKFKADEEGIAGKGRRARIG